ncbi:hypothetical protein [Streptomyces sp. B6B3]|uniref:hypothetical protein n=1 Tax=Streptomyces sp. B6B3 TaxID=3153570 RepID=UPI00325DE980
MGWTVLYIAFGVVALWLLGEVLLQYKARLRWRLVAFCGFLGVVVGVVLPSVPVIALGAVAFAAGQTFVTLSFRRGFSTGWALGGKPGTSRRRRSGGGMRPMDPVAEEQLAAGGGEYPAVDGPPPPPAPYQEEYRPAPDGGADEPDGGYPDQYGDARQDGGYEEPYETTAAYQTVQAPPGGADGGPYPEEIFPDAPPYQPATGYGDGYPGGYDGYGAGDGYPGPPPPDQQPVAQPYEPAYAAYTDPYLGDPAGTGADSYADYGAQQSYPPGPEPEQQAYGGGYAPDYGAGLPGEAYYTETPPGGVWMPQQRESDPAAEAYGYPQGEPQPDGYGGQGYYFDSGPRY